MFVTVINAAVSYTCAQPGFVVYPEARNQSYGTTATFYCKHPQAHLLQWIINGSETSEYSSNSGCDDDFDGVSLCFLKIPANETTNNTVIQCKALPNLGITDPVSMLVQGIVY